ncbi:MAG TPA: hypothetical protein VMT03_07745 [Polyangia bacterium]|nr:hypothetical protein [Polyangia bacterium]
MDRQASATESVTLDPVASPERQSHVVRKRRSRGSLSSRQWVAARSRRRIIRITAICTGVLLLMALGLYLGLERQDSASSIGGFDRGGVIGPRGTV